MSNLRNQNALRQDRFQKQIATQHDSRPVEAIQLPQLCLNWNIAPVDSPMSLYKYFYEQD